VLPESRLPRDMAAAARQFDPIPRFERYLRHHGLLDDTRISELAERADAEVVDGVQFAQQAALPPVARAFEDVYTSS
jgi:pyruvate dehydrogenase E1 component alpha subunit